MHCTEFVPFIAVLGVLGVLCWEKIRKEPLLSGLIGTLGLLFVVFVAVLVFDCVEAGILNLLGLELKKGEKIEALKFLGLGMGGILLVLQALASHKRAKAMEDAVLKTELGQQQERMKNAIEHLGNASDSVRLGGAYELFHLAEDTEDRGQRQTVLDILCAHIRWTTLERQYRGNSGGGGDGGGGEYIGYRGKYPLAPSEEIQSLLTLLFVQKYKVFTGLDIKLQGSCLNGSILIQARLEKAHLEGAQLHRARLEGARLQGADLIRAQLHRADLRRAQLQGADLRRAQLQGARLEGARLRGARLEGARLQEADLIRAQLQGADLRRARLQEADLRDAQLQGAYLRGAQLQGAYLRRAQLQGADLRRAQLQGADLRRAQLQGTSSSNLKYFNESFEAVINKRIGQESDLDGVIFAGGLTQEAVDSMCNGLSDEAANELREKLEAHIEEPQSHELPENSGASIEAYTEEEARRWIAEYKTAMSESG